jgi:ubiquitin carboxyl-terminal hydrolase 22/27/51
MIYHKLLTQLSFRFSKNSTLDVEDTQYELFALTVHIGSLDSGHYVAYTKRNGKWYLFNDEDYEIVKESDALNQEAYLLFYRKVTL